MLERLETNWRQSGLETGDVLLLHSSIKRTIETFQNDGISLTPPDILQSFLNVLGPMGTLLIPLFNFDFTNGTDFDIRHTPSQMGALTEAARLHPEAVRTGHPIYSFAVIGNLKSRFSTIDNFSGYGADSPFGMLRELNGKIGVLDLPDQNSMTFYHHVEEMKAASYRYFKEFSAGYIDLNGVRSERTYKLFVRDIENGVLTYVDPCGELLWQAGLYQGSRPGVGSGFRTINSNEMFKFTAELIDRSMALNNLYRYES